MMLIQTKIENGNVANSRMRKEKQVEDTDFAPQQVVGGIFCVRLTDGWGASACSGTLARRFDSSPEYDVLSEGRQTAGRVHSGGHY
jgi:hypothetical protein